MRDAVDDDAVPRGLVHPHGADLRRLRRQVGNPHGIDAVRDRGWKRLFLAEQHADAHRTEFIRNGTMGTKVQGAPLGPVPLVLSPLQGM